MSALKPSVQVSEWKALVSWIYDQLDEDSREKILFYYEYDEEHFIEDRESDETKKSDQMKFFDAVCNNNVDELESARNLRNLMELHNLHSIQGESFVDHLDECIQHLEEEKSQLEVLTDTRFIGRTAEIQSVNEKIQEEKVQVVYICGLGGQGKTYLSRKVLLQLKQETPALVIARVDLRNVSNTNNVIKSILSQCPGSPDPGDNLELEQLLALLQQYLQDLDQSQKFIFYMDDCDVVLAKDKPMFEHFIKEFMNLLQGCKAWVKVVMTGRVKLSGINQDVHLAEIELLELEKEDAIQMFYVYSEVAQAEIDYILVEEIVAECAYSPLAISMMADQVRSGKLTPQKLCFHLKMDKKNVTAQMKVGKCIESSIANLPSDHLRSLVGLSVFQSSSFNVANAEKVIKKCLNNQMGNDGSIHHILQTLYDFHLLEAEDKSRKSSYQNKQRRKCRYSLHPLVYRYLAEWKKPDDLNAVYRLAVQQFVSIFEKMIAKIVQLWESEHHKGQKKLEENKVHILRYYEIMSDNAGLLAPHIRKTSDSILFQKKCVSDVADVLLSLVQNRRMFQSEADRALKAKNHDVYIFWMVEKADLFVMLHDKPDISMQILDELSQNKYTALQRMDDRVFYRPLVHALFHKVKGLTYCKMFNFQTAQQHLDLSLKFYEKCPQPKHDMQIARVKCYQACVLIELDQLDLAEQTLHEVLSKMREIVRSSYGSQRSNTVDDECLLELHWDIPRIYTNLAKLKLKRALGADDSTYKHQCLEKTLEDLHHGMKLDKLLKLDRLDGYYAKVKLKADVLIEKGLLEEALIEANFASDQRRMILQPPHTRYTESVYQVGRIYMLQGDEWSKKGNPEKAREYWVCAGDYFDEVKDHHLKEGGMSLLNPELQKIKRDHIKVAELVKSQREVKSIERFYRDLENGSYEPEKISSSKSILRMIYTPFEMVKNYFGGGGSSFGADQGALGRLEALGHQQHERMLRGEPSGGRRKDSGMGNSSFEDDSVSSGSGSMSEHMARLDLQKSTSIEDNVFKEPLAEDDSQQAKQKKFTKKRQKTIADD